MVTEQEARDMDAAIIAFHDKDTQTQRTQFDADKAIAETWWNTLGIDIQGALTRDEAIDNYRQIESLLQTETDRFRLVVLKEKLVEADEKFRERKRNG